jgi:hypothetical protein
VDDQCFPSYQCTLGQICPAGTSLSAISHIPVLDPRLFSKTSAEGIVQRGITLAVLSGLGMHNQWKLLRFTKLLYVCGNRGVGSFSKTREKRQRFSKTCEKESESHEPSRFV